MACGSVRNLPHRLMEFCRPSTFLSLTNCTRTSIFSKYPENNESAGKDNAIIRYIICECANAARMTKSSLSSKYHYLKVHKSHKKCIVAIVHKLICIIYFILSQRDPYRIPRGKYKAMSTQKNAPRRINALRKLGLIPTAKPVLT